MVLVSDGGSLWIGVYHNVWRWAVPYGNAGNAASESGMVCS
jgi:hypothetical protein